MKTLLEKVKEFLQKNEWARDRRNRADAVFDIFIAFRNKFESNFITKQEFVDYAFTDFQSINRLILKVQQENEELRGSDYEDKKRLEQQAKVDLGYEVGYHNDTSMRVQNKLL